MESFYRKKDEAKELLIKEKKGLFLDQDILGGQGFYHADCLFLLGREGTHKMDLSYLCFTRKF